MKKSLLIIDPQNDFITGSLLVEDAQMKISALTDYITTHPAEFETILVTLDWHPKNHISFAKNGGEWPEHCVMYTWGALPESNLWNSILEEKKVIVLEKGKNQDEEEYGAFDTLENIKFAILPGRANFREVDEIWVAGIMSEYCVLESLKGLIKFEGIKPKLRVKLDWIATMDNHKKLIEFCNKENIEYGN